MVPGRRPALAALANREDFTERRGPRVPGRHRPLPGRLALRIRYKAALDRAGLRQLRFHDLRHTFGTLAVRRAEVPAVQAWMGHADIQTTMRYVHHRDRGGEAGSWPRLPVVRCDGVDRPARTDRQVGAPSRRLEIALTDSDATDSVRTGVRTSWDVSSR